MFFLHFSFSQSIYFRNWDLELFDRTNCETEQNWDECGLFDRVCSRNHQRSWKFFVKLHWTRRRNNRMESFVEVNDVTDKEENAAERVAEPFSFIRWKSYGLSNERKSASLLFCVGLVTHGKCNRTMFLTFSLHLYRFSWTSTLQLWISSGKS